MTVATDIARIIAQEQQLVFEGFDPDIALALGLDIKARAEDMGQAVAIDVRLWDRQLFWFAMRGTTADNAEWVRRKINVVRRFQKSSYRMLLERGGEGVMQPHWGLDFSKYVFAGGGFPITVEGVGVVGAVTVSGLPGRDDHGLVVEALCVATGADHDALALPPQ
ncbi:heme-degrading domain-containing protein [Mariluticola halotolerans]|uniref:heme-degrading domain-containing protein n=1 Tax=Mariluticola halotolerans TaxID=2909283 RepID=UPI0026E18468|nr:heme-degrading domain-containing protein [Mariluticola halotolerans]UJQ95503.1 heme-degrading domain-containing protein [Mariluticola halotolerans]